MMLHLERAKKIASEWHDGQPSRLYSFASTGKRFFPVADYVEEIERCEPENDVDTMELEQLAEYIDSLPRERSK